MKYRREAKSIYRPMEGILKLPTASSTIKNKTRLSVGSKKMNYIIVPTADQMRKKYDHARTRTWNPLIRSQVPYPLGHAADYENKQTWNHNYYEFFYCFVS